MLSALSLTLFVFAVVRSVCRFILDEAAEAKRLGQNVLVLTHHAPSMKNTSHPMHEVLSCNLVLCSFCLCSK